MRLGGPLRASWWLGKKGAGRSFSVGRARIAQALSGTVVKNIPPTMVSGPEGSNSTLFRAGRTVQVALDNDQRRRMAARGVDSVITGVRRLPLRTKAAVGVGAVSYYGWMRSKKRDKYYTHYYDF